MVDYAEGEDMIAAIRKSYQGMHVHGLLVPPEPVNYILICGNKHIFLCKTSYVALCGFRYSSRILSVAVVSFCLLYAALVELMIGIIPLFEFFELMIGIVWTLAGNGQLQEAALLFGLTDIVYYLETFQIGIDYAIGISLYIINVLKISFIVSLSVAFAIGVVNNLLELYKGNSCHLTPQTEKSSGSLLSR
ncbi:hypothetical protein KUTeg_024883 [Tegillarca granosa]|uniref:Uncharacterized protein n=1 Tax=Tegillarca granosa TaxID=220873 RepID=A0ABQ9E3A7_TEGGR|nr:hypothetical protein KUTeg_024883 [Tegillarca granosa]